MVGLIKGYFSKIPQIAAIVSGTNYHNIKIFSIASFAGKVYAVSPGHLVLNA